MYRSALTDKHLAARCLAALFRGEESEHANAGSLLIADGLHTIRAFGSVHIKFSDRGD